MNAVGAAGRRWSETLVPALVVGIALACSCSSVPRTIDGSTEVAAKRSIGAMSRSLTGARQKSFSQAVTQVAIEGVGDDQVIAHLEHGSYSAEMLKNIDGKTIDAVLAEASSISDRDQRLLSEHAAYKSKIALALHAPDREAMRVAGEVKNLGDRSLDMVVVTIYLLDSTGKRIHEEDAYPVFVGTGFGEKDAALKPNYSRVFTTSLKAPSEWAGRIEGEVKTYTFTPAGAR